MDREKPLIKNKPTGRRGAIINDTYQEQLRDLFLLRNPRYRFSNDFEKPLSVFIKKAPKGKWVYFSWLKTWVHILPEDYFLELRTGRNREIITQQEQSHFYRMNIGVAGLSVGSHSAITIALMGGGKNMRIADNDILSPSNLNRVHYSLLDVGFKKCNLAARKIYQINPYANLELFSEGVTDENMMRFLSGPPKLDVLVEEMDNLEMKIKIRFAAKKLGIPVIMGTDNADNIIVDVERYDKNKELKIFNGRVGNLTMDDFRTLSPQDMPKISTKIAGKDKVAPRMQQSLLKVGREIYSWPQLGDAAIMSGVVTAYLARRIANNFPLKSGQYEVNVDSIFDPTYNLKQKVRARKKELNDFLNKIGL